MSNFEALATHPHTYRTEMAYWIDDYFGRHKYGVQFPSEPDKVYTEEEVTNALAKELDNEQ